MSIILVSQGKEKRGYDIINFQKTNPSPKKQYYISPLIEFLFKKTKIKHGHNTPCNRSETVISIFIFIYFNTKSTRKIHCDHFRSVKTKIKLCDLRQLTVLKLKKKLDMKIKVFFILCKKRGNSFDPENTLQKDSASFEEYFT